VFPPAAEAYAELRRELGLEAAPRVAILTASGSIPPDRAVLEDAPIVLTTAAGADRLAGTLPAGVEIVTLPGEAEVDVTAAVEHLRERGHCRILSEAGPHVFGSLVEAGLVDELFLTVSPLLAGRPSSGSFGLVEGAALLPGHGRRARLRSARVQGSHLFLQYGLR
jgi:riboflavin biosynthesis pyrimidine reductase